MDRLDISRVRSGFDQVLRRIRLHRRLIAAVCAAAAVYLTISASAMPAQPTTRIVTAARDIGAGAVLTADDLAVSEVLRAAAPSQAFTKPDEVVGRLLAGPLTRGSPLTRPGVLGDHWPLADDGQTAVPIRLGDPSAVDLLRVGDHLRVLAIDAHQPDKAAVVAPAAVVLAIPPKPDSRTSISATQGRLIVVGVPAERAEVVAAASVSRHLTVTWSR